jgi:hypothetical protein
MARERQSQASFAPTAIALSPYACSTIVQVVPLVFSPATCSFSLIAKGAVATAPGCSGATESVGGNTAPPGESEGTVPGGVASRGLRPATHPEMLWRQRRERVLLRYPGKTPVWHWGAIQRRVLGVDVWPWFGYRSRLAEIWPQPFFRRGGQPHSSDRFFHFPYTDRAVVSEPWLKGNAVRIIGLLQGGQRRLLFVG